MRDASAGALSRLRRWLYVGLGVLSVGLAVVGAIVPGMPATVFLIIASYFLTRSCPSLEKRLLQHRIFAPYLPYVRAGTPMPRRARVVAVPTRNSIGLRKNSRWATRGAVTRIREPLPSGGGHVWDGRRPR